MPIDDDSGLLGPALKALQAQYPLGQVVAYDPKQEWDTRTAETGTITGWSPYGMGVYVQFDDGGGAKYVEPRFLLSLDSNGEHPEPDEDRHDERDGYGRDLTAGYGAEQANADAATPLLPSEWRQVSDTEIEVDVAAVLARTGRPVLLPDPFGDIRGLSIHGKDVLPDYDALRRDEVTAEEGDLRGDPLMPETPRPILDQEGRDVGSISHPMDAADAHALAWAQAENGNHSVVLMPTLADVIAVERHPEHTLAAIRTLNHSVWTAISKAIRADLDGQDTRGTAMSASAVAIENAMVEVYGSEPRSLARIFVQSVIDEVLDLLIPADPTEEPEPPTRDRTYIPPDTEPALPVEDTITPSGRGPGYHPGSVAQAIGRDVTAAIASLETGATVAADVDFSTVVGVRPDVGEHVQITLPVRLDITGVQR